jgi:hypothetical protein
MRQDMRTLTAATTWASLGRFFDVDDLVVAADSLLFSPREVAKNARTREPLRDAYVRREDLQRVLSLGRWRGAENLRQALELSEERCASRPETSTRLLLGRAGLPKPTLNTDVLHRGKFIGRPDIQYPDYKVELEYQSAYHRSAEQYEEDINRRRRFEEAGWIVVELTAKLVYGNPQEAIRRVVHALRSRGWTG